MPTARSVRKTSLKKALVKLRDIFIRNGREYELDIVSDILSVECGGIVVNEKRIAHNEVVVVAKFEGVPRHYLDVMFLLSDNNVRVKIINGILRELLP